MKLIELTGFMVLIHKHARKLWTSQALILFPVSSPLSVNKTALFSQNFPCLGEEIGREKTLIPSSPSRWALTRFQTPYRASNLTQTPTSLVFWGNFWLMEILVVASPSKQYRVGF